MQHNFRFTLVLVGLSVIVFSGCTNPDSKFVKVEGTITFNGEAVEGATVTFDPADSNGESATGTTDASGKYKLTSAGAKNTGSGALPGSYTVRVMKTQTTYILDQDEEAYQRGDIDYDELQKRNAAKNRQDSGAKAERKELLPEVYSRASRTPLKATVEKGKTGPIDFDLKAE